MAAADGTDAEGISRSRLESLSDAVIAVAITLLVLGIDAPRRAPGESLWQALDAGTLGSLALFALSFVAIARFWMIHHDAVRKLPERVPGSIVILNFAFLLVLCLIPFSTTLFADNSDQLLALVIYASVFAAVSFLLALIGADPTRGLTVGSLAIPGVFLLAIPAAFIVGPGAAPWVWLLLSALASDRVQAILARPLR